MSDTRTVSILQRVPVILAVTAASYGLTAQARQDRPVAADTHKAAADHKPGAKHKRTTSERPH